MFYQAGLIIIHKTRLGHREEDILHNSDNDNDYDTDEEDVLSDFYITTSSEEDSDVE